MPRIMDWYSVWERLKQAGYQKLFEFQKKAIAAFIKGQDVLVKAPTGAGKTLIPLICATFLLGMKKRCVFVVPTRRLIDQTCNRLTAWFDSLPRYRGKYSIVRVTGDDRPSHRKIKKAEIIVTTFESLNGMLVRNYEYSLLKKVGLIVPSHKLDDALGIEAIGRYTNEGMGEIIWKDAKYVHKPLDTKQKIRFRKMLPTNLTETQHKLLIAMLLHDCVHTERHNSKIYVKVELQDDYVSQLVNNHHNYQCDEREIPLLSILQYYDRLSSSLSRKFRFSTTSRYRVSELNKIDFHSLARDLEHRQHSLYALYSYIYKSQELKKVNEALVYGFSSLKNHMLLMVNLYLNDTRQSKVSLAEW